ncbi:MULTISPECIES: glycosyltransferase family 4 protein [Pseudomonas]|uniref:glycosyltransferase family 4 protein n=1 Tax=Pseudomonas nitroreducens TaxID=46680 RepID=UPI001E4B19DB|nr:MULTISPECIES: glycosyltransferase family 4 protein [Pseudomonas]MCE4070163.1 glycosyltransferase family 4 protein [Pseudomonas nitritireducens]MCE4078768.1 glycosyltransferase family 4 protein [Pseudomonas nitroreducens]
MKILHITESFGGGVTSAINSYILNSQQHEHYLLASVRKGDTTGEESQGLFKHMELVPRRLASLARVKPYIDRIQPDVIHLHSTYAGALIRALPFIPAQKIVYTPHGFAFLRGDHPMMLKAYRAIESLLARRTAVIAGCGMDEQRIAGELIEPGHTLGLVNVCDELPEVPTVRSLTSKPVVGMVGRISRQKGHDYFRAVAESCRDVAHFKWIGGGDAQVMAEMVQAGIEVTGWRQRDEVIAHMKGLDLYFHTAAWDGFPISVLEAAKLDLPIALRRIGPFVAEGLATAHDLTEAKRQVIGFTHRDPAVLAQLSRNSQCIQRQHSGEQLQSSLENLYSRFNPAHAVDRLATG